MIGLRLSFLKAKLASKAVVNILLLNTFGTGLKFSQRSYCDASKVNHDSSKSSLDSSISNEIEKKTSEYVDKALDSFRRLSLLDPIIPFFGSGPLVTEHLPHLGGVLLDIYETKDSYKVVAGNQIAISLLSFAQYLSFSKPNILNIELPGYTIDEIDVNVVPGQLTLSAAKSSDTTEEDKDTKYHKRERVWGSTKRTISLPHDIEIDNLEKVSSEYNNGVLTLVFPKSSPKRILDSPRKILLKK